MANLQSSLNSDQGLGTASLATIYITIIISCLFLPPIMIKNIGLKWTIVISQICYLLFIAANMYPKWYILMPGKYYTKHMPVIFLNKIMSNRAIGKAISLFIDLVDISKKVKIP